MMPQKKYTVLLKYFPAATSGLLLSLSFPKIGLSVLAFFALVPLLVSLRKMTVKEAFYAGLTAGVSHFLMLIYWIVPTVHVYGGLHPVLAVSTLFFLSFYLALYPAVFAVVLKKTDPKPWLAPLFAAGLWVGLEYIRTYAFTGFSWGTLGYSQFANRLVIQIADFTGVYGISFLIVLVNCLLAMPFAGAEHRQGKGYFIPIFYTAFLVAATLVYGGRRIRAIESLMRTAPRTTLSVVQGNIQQDLKWSDDFREKTIEKYIRLSGSAAQKGPDLIIWPETALPFYYGFDAALSNRVDQAVRSLKTNFLIGSPAFASDEKEIRFYNRAYMINRFSIVTGTYDKTHLVPFGEYVPLGKYLAFLGKITEQAGNFSSGAKSFVPLKFNGHQTGVLICFEILFPSIASGFVQNGADILTTITNDAWFGNTPAAQQHFSIAVFRAIENRRSVARAANTGISGFIDPTGTILDASATFKDLTLTRQVPALSQITFYTKYGDLFAITSLIAIFLCFVVKGIRKKAEEKSK